jgi:hypothetical protein
MATVNSDIFKPTKFGGKYTATLIPGDGIGAEVTESVKAIFKADNVPIEWEQVDVSGMDTGDKHAEELFRESIASLKRNKLGLKGMEAPIFSSRTCSDQRNIQLSDFLSRHSSHPRRAIWSPVLQCRPSSGTRHLCFHSTAQEHPRLRNAPQECRPVHHPREHRGRVLGARAPVCQRRRRVAQDHYPRKFRAYRKVCLCVCAR